MWQDVVSVWQGMQSNLGWTEALIAIGFSVVFSLIVYFMYQFFYGSRHIGAGVQRMFLLGGPAITVLFLGIQTSIPLSLGLLGALSFVRFRTPVKDPAEIGFLLVLIACSIGASSGNFMLIMLLLVAVFIILLVKWFLRDRAAVGARGSLMLSVDQAEFDQARTGHQGIPGRHAQRPQPRVDVGRGRQGQPAVPVQTTGGFRLDRVRQRTQPDDGAYDSGDIRRMNKKILTTALVTVLVPALAFGATACSSADSASAETVVASSSGSAATAATASSSSGSTASSSGSAAATVTVASEALTASWDTEDTDAAYDASSAYQITLNGDSIAFAGTGATVSGSTITITEPGTYVLSGTLNDGQIVVDTATGGNVRLVLNGADITCSTSAPIYVKNADKAIITLADGTQNKVTDGSSLPARRQHRQRAQRGHLQQGRPEHQRLRLPDGEGQLQERHRHHQRPQDRRRHHHRGRGERRHPGQGQRRASRPAPSR